MGAERSPLVHRERPPTGMSLYLQIRFVSADTFVASVVLPAFWGNRTVGPRLSSMRSGCPAPEFHMRVHSVEEVFEFAVIPQADAYLVGVDGEVEYVAVAVLVA